MLNKTIGIRIFADLSLPVVRRKFLPLKRSRSRPSRWIRPALAFSGGLLLAVSFPMIGWFWLAWLGHGLILAAAFGQSPGTAFRLGCCAGVSQFFIPFYWLLLIPFTGQAVAAWLLVGGWLTCYTALWTTLCSWLLSASVPPPGRGLPAMTLAKAFETLPMRQKILRPFMGAVVWVAMEMGISRLFNGLPYAVGVSQYQFLPLIQIASITGVYGVSLVLVWMSLSLGLIGWRYFHDQPWSKLWLLELSWPVAGLGVLLAFGCWQLAERESSIRVLRIALVQPNISQRQIWEPAEKTNRFQRLLRLSEQALESRPDLLVWPEAAMPNFFTRFNPALHDGLLQLSDKRPVWMILGATDARPRPGVLEAKTAEQLEVFNSSFLIDPSGQLVGKYHKRRLVMFGEYLPLARWFPFLKRFRSLDGGYEPGREAVPFSLTNLNVKVAMLICAEDTYPHLVRQSVAEETDFILNLTNDGWFGESAAQWQHAVDALFRAVENGRPLVRCANNGLTCWIDRRGRMQAVYFPGSRNIYQAGFKIVDIPLSDPARKWPLTFYGRHGDWFGWTCVGLSLVLAGQRYIRSRGAGQKPHRV